MEARHHNHGHSHGGGKRHGHGHSHGARQHHRNPLPLTYSYGNPDGLFSGGLLPDGLARNPDLANSLMKGSAITQDVSIVDVGSGGFSFLFNNWAVRTLGLKDWFGVLASAIVPFITGSLVSMWREDLGTAVFFGGELEAFMKFLGEVTRNSGMKLGLVDTGAGFMLDVPKPLALGAAHAGSLFDVSQVRFPRSGELAPLAPSATVEGVAGSDGVTNKRTVVI